MSNVTNFLSGYWKQAASLIYPKLCIGCLSNMSSKNEELCISCEYKIPRTNHHLEHRNAFTNRFISRIPIQTGAACFVFTKGGTTQSLIHQIKYNGHKEFAQTIGQYYGKKLILSAHYQDIDTIIPVPMHPLKEAIRGYNQADWFGMGLAETMSTSFLKNGLLKVSQTVSQTRFGRFQRFDNVQEVFKLGKENLEGRHVLLVDDVLTTGATLEACANELFQVPNIKVSIVTIAYGVGY